MLVARIVYSKPQMVHDYTFWRYSVYIHEKVTHIPTGSLRGIHKDTFVNLSMIRFRPFGGYLNPCHTSMKLLEAMKASDFNRLCCR